MFTTYSGRHTCTFGVKHVTQATKQATELRTACCAKYTSFPCLGPLLRGSQGVTSSRYILSRSHPSRPLSLCWLKAVLQAREDRVAHVAAQVSRYSMKGRLWSWGVAPASVEMPNYLVKTMLQSGTPEEDRCCITAVPIAHRAEDKAERRRDTMLDVDRYCFFTLQLLRAECRGCIFDAEQ